MKIFSRENMVVFILLVLIYAFGVFLRLGVTMYVKAENNNQLPFTLESALLYRYAYLLSEGESLPKQDYKAQYPEGVKVLDKFSIGGELIPVFIYRFFGLKKWQPFHEFIRYFFPFWFCLGVFALYLSTLIITEDKFSSLLAALLYICSLTSIIRSTGQEFSRENFALPLIFFSFYFLLNFLKTERRSAAIFSGGFLSLSLSFWDMTQCYLYILVFFVLFKFLGKNSEKLKPYVTIISLWLLFCGVVVPYLRAHYFIYSYAMAVLYSLVIVSFLPNLILKDRRIIKNCLLLGIIVLVSALFYCLFNYDSVYAHFQQLLICKIKFLNVKPLNPLKLPFMVRILWTPALHSISFSDFRYYLNILPFLGVIPVLYLSIKWIKGKTTVQEEIILFFCINFLFLFVFFARMMVYTIFYLSILIGYSLYLSRKFLRQYKVFHNIYKIFLVLLLFLVVAANTNRVSAVGEIDIRRGVYIPGKIDSIKRIYPFYAVKAVVEWVKYNTKENSVILANFGLSPSFLTYADRTIVLHPKFEDTIMREKVKCFLFSLFDKEEVFYEYCQKYGVNYYVHENGTAEGSSIYGYKYIVGEKKIVGNSIVYCFERNVQSLRHFELCYENYKYKIFKVIEK